MGLTRIGLGRQISSVLLMIRIAFRMSTQIRPIHPSRQSFAACQSPSAAGFGILALTVRTKTHRALLGLAQDHRSRGNEGGDNSQIHNRSDDLTAAKLVGQSHGAQDSSLDGNDNGRYR